ncbi:MAG TPA: DMT family transporter [Acidimicrobiia bacterium]|nr:DMT family transporter [Acidimicrobiia bacterium]
MNPLFLAGLAALAYGTADFYGGVASRRTDATRVVLWSQVVGLALGAVAAPVFGGAIGLADVAWGAAAGMAGALGLVSLYRGLSIGRAAVVAPMSGVLAGVVPGVVGLGLGERPSAVTAVGFALAALAVWLVSGGRLETSSGFSLGVLAGLGFGLFFVLLSPIPDTAGLWPLIPARSASIAVLLLIRRKTEPSPVSRATMWLIAAVGVGDMLANVFILLALQRGPLGEGAVVSSLYPAVTVLLSALILRETVRRLQWLGLALAVVAMALIAS